MEKVVRAFEWVEAGGTGISGSMLKVIVDGAARVARCDGMQRHVQAVGAWAGSG